MNNDSILIYKAARVYKYDISINHHLRSGSQRVKLRPAEAIKHRVGENLMKVTFSTCEGSLATSTPLVLQTCTRPFSLPESTNLESGVKEHSIMED